MKSQTQIKLDKKMFVHRLEFGGELSKRSKFRTARPFSSKDTMHMVLKSSAATGKFSLGNSKNLEVVNRIVHRHCAKYGVKLLKYSNNFNHLHLHLKFASRALYLKFVRSLTASIAMAVTGASKLISLKEILGAKKFWDYRPFTRIVRSVRAYKTIQNYILLNQLEASGIVPIRAGRLRDLTTEDRKHLRSSCLMRPESAFEERQFSWI